tara:strand:+ start:890 stop:1549 length:660 start_codon:yes stop_codon:yes gene_type:complete
MIIFRNHIYIHVPKTGGSSFEAMCDTRHRISVLGDQHDIAADIPTKHLDKELFGFMRNPMHAEISNWRYHFFAWGSEKMTFEQWCEWRYGDKPQEYGYELGLNDDQVKYGYSFNVRPSAGYFCDSSGACVADQIFRYEGIVENLKTISKMLGFDCSIDGFQNMEYNWSRGREQYSKYVTPRSEELVRQAKEIDFRLTETEGDIPIEYSCPVVQRYAYTR